MGSRGHPVVALWVALALAVAMTGCGRRDRGTTTVVFWQFFHHEHPGIRVEVEQLTWQSGREKIVAAVAAGRPPDLCEIGSTFLPGLVADSTLIDLTDSIADLKPELRGWRVTEYLGRSYAIPWMLGTRAM